MTLRLILTRHAKSSWGDPDSDDHERRLSRRGQNSARAIGKWLTENDYCAEQVLSSTATRTAETWAEISLQCNRDPELEFTSALYHATPENMLNVLHGANRNPVMMLGHNPGIAALAAALVSEAPKHHKFGQYPTAATTVIDFDAKKWADVEPGSGKVVAFVVPRELTG